MAKMEDAAEVAVVAVTEVAEANVGVENNSLPKQ